MCVTTRNHFYQIGPIFFTAMQNCLVNYFYKTHFLFIPQGGYMDNKLKMESFGLSVKYEEEKIDVAIINQNICILSIRDLQK